MSKSQIAFNTQPPARDWYQVIKARILAPDLRATDVAHALIARVDAVC